MLSAGVLGTVKLLLRLRDEGRLPDLSDRLGDVVRTNSEAIVGASVANGARPELTRGRGHHVVDPPRRAPPTSSRAATRRGSNAMGLLTTVLRRRRRQGAPPAAVPAAGSLRHPVAFLRSLSVQALVGARRSSCW